jgi:hypothetical protein
MTTSKLIVLNQHFGSPALGMAESNIKLNQRAWHFQACYDCVAWFPALIFMLDPHAVCGASLVGIRVNYVMVSILWALSREHEEFSGVYHSSRGHGRTDQL